MLQAIDFVPGDIVKVHQKIQEGEKTRIQIFKGTVLQIRGRGINKMFTVQKMVGPNVSKVEVSEHSKKKIRRAKLNYLKVAKVRP
jgi:large subunit ribosomal protein L19